MEKATGNEQDVQVIDPQLLPEIIEESLQHNTHKFLIIRSLIK